MPPNIHVAAPSSTNSERLTARPARENFLIICGCTEPTGTATGTLCVERGRPMWLITMLTDTNSPVNKQTYIENRKAPSTPGMTNYEESFFFPLGNHEKKKKGLRSRASIISNFLGAERV